MKPRDKIFLIINKILELIKLAPEGKSIELHYRYLPELDNSEVDLILEKLQYDEKVLIVIHKNILHPAHSLIHINQPAFNIYARKIIDEMIIEKEADAAAAKRAITKFNSANSTRKAPKAPEQKTPTTSAPIILQQQSHSKKDSNALWLTFSPQSGEILLNDIFLISTLQYKGTNALVFDYIFRHPKRDITRAEFAKNSIDIGKKDCHKIINSIGFKGKLRELFFRVSKQTIYFNNPVEYRSIKGTDLPLRIQIR